jgi:hypothetical protein
MSFFRKPTPIPVYQGGTGDVYFSSGYALIGNGYSALLELTPSTAGNVMTSNGTTWTSAPASGTGTVNSGTAYQLAYYAASGTAVSTLGSLGTNGQVLTSGGAGVAPTWTTISAGSAATPTALGTVYGKTDTALTTANLGYQAGNGQTTGDRNVCVGYQANKSGTDSSTVTAIGYQAIGGTGNAQRAVAVGFQALYSHQAGAGVYNTAVGWQCGYGVTTGAENTSMGHQAFYSATTANDCTAIGHSSQVNTIGNANTSLGSFSLSGSGTPANNTGTLNTAVGYKALYAITTGFNNVAVGYVAMQSMTSGANNTAIGLQSFQAATAGSNNTGCGLNTLYSQVNADANTAVGMNALYANQYGGSNTVVGYHAADNLNGGQNNIYIGASSSASSTTVNSEFVFGVNTTGKGASTGFINPNSGGVYQGNNSTLWSVTSDQRLKKNIVDNTIGLEAINQIKVRNFEYRLPNEVTELDSKNAINIAGVQLGAIAQELKEILPDCVKTESTGVMSVDASNITWHLINAIKELNAKVIALEARGA